LVIAEAMASGKAIVATETVGGKELLQNNETGKLVPVGNIEELAKAIDELLTDKNLRQTLGKKAQIAAKENFSLERMITDTEKVYQKII
jgi:glycosyltransferase involved in cell wall biosynthesis